MMPLTEQQKWESAKLSAAIHGSAVAKHRLQMMKAEARRDPPRATTEHMPFAGHRNCAEWMKS